MVFCAAMRSALFVTILVSVFCQGAWAFPNRCSLLLSPNGGDGGGGSSHSRRPVIGVVDPVSSANRFSEAVQRLTGQTVIHIQTQDFSTDFIGSFRPNDSNAQLVRISWPPSSADIGRLRALGVTNLLTGPVSLEATQHLCRTLHLPMVGPDSAVIADKEQQQNMLGQAGEPYIPGHRVFDLADALDTFRRFGSEAVLKPNSGYGTVNVSFVRSEAEVRAKAEGHLKDGLLMERFVPGVEYFVDFVTYSNPKTGRIEHRFVNAARYRKVELVARAPIYSSIRILPYRGIIQDRLSAQSRRALDVFQQRNGNTHAEFMLEVHDADVTDRLVRGESIPGVEASNPIFPIEFNFRKPGGDVPYYAQKYALSPKDLNHTDASVLAIADPWRLATTPEGWTLVNHLDISFLFAPRPGNYNLKAVLNLLAQYPGVVREVIPASLEQGAPVVVTNDLFKALGKVIIAHPDSNVVTRVSEEIFARSMRGEFSTAQ
jgi:hypothetical protein